MKRESKISLGLEYGIPITHKPPPKLLSMEELKQKYPEAYKKIMERQKKIKEMIKELDVEAKKREKMSVDEWLNAEEEDDNLEFIEDNDKEK